MQPPSEDKDPPAYDSMYPGEAQEEQKKDRSQGQRVSFRDVEGQSLRRMQTKDPREVVVTRSDSKTGRKAGSEGKEAAAEGTVPRSEEGRKEEKEKSKKERKKLDCMSVPGAKDVLKDFCTKTTAHGFSHIVKSGQPLLMRVFWFLVTTTGILMLISASYQVTHTVLIVQRPSIEVIHIDKYGSGMRVPYMTICSLAGFWKSKLEKHNVSNALASYLLLAVRGTEIISPALETNPARKTVLQDELDNYLRDHNLTLSQMVSLLSPQCEDLIVVCMGSTDIMYRWQCCGELMRTTLTSLGQCFTSLGPAGETTVLTQTFAGLLGGYKVIFAVNASEQMVYDSKIVSSPSLAEAGIHVSLSNFDLSPSVATSMQALRVAPNTAVSVALSFTSLDRSERYRDMWPWSEPTCVTEDKFWNLSEAERSTVHHNLFFHTFYRTCPLEFTNCTLLPRRFMNDTTAECHPSDILYQKAKHKEMKLCLEEHLNHDKSEHMLCEVTEITQQTSHTTLVQQLMEAHEGVTIIPNLTYSMINIYYTQLGYTQHRENVPTLFTWFSSLGGQMGLFLGASMITLVEVYFTLCRVLRVIVFALVSAACRWVKRCLKPPPDTPA